MSTDPRFAKLHTDPRFVRPKASKSKLVLDDRFKSLLDPSSSQASSSTAAPGPKVDKYGRKRKDGGDGEDLRRYYRLEKEEEEVEVDEEPATKKLDLARGEGALESSDEEGEGEDEEEEEEESGSGSDSDTSDGPVTIGGGGLAARGLRRRLSPSPQIDLSEDAVTFPDSDSEGEQEDDDEEDMEPTTRVAIVNMDWDHLRASDLFRVLASPLALVAPPPSTSSASYKKSKKTFNEDGEEELDKLASGKLQIIRGRLLKLVIYVSEFGKERIEREEREGPPKELFLDGGNAEDGEASELEEMDSDEDDEITERDVLREQIGDAEEDYDGEALRRYQLERLRYYYAIATFDNPTSAAHVVSEINGTEFERTANVFDLQFVPEETSFDDSPIHDEATESSIAATASTYTGIDFVTDALRHSKVKLTWDADDPHRRDKLSKFLAASMDKSKGKGKGKEVDEDEVKAYLASSSDEDDEEEEEEEEDDFFVKEKKSVGKRDKLRSLFGLDAGGGGIGGSGFEDVEGEGGKKGKGQRGNTGNEGEMQITFAPALTEEKEALIDEEINTKSRGKGTKSKEEPALETYKRKEKERRERKKEERRKKRAGLPVGTSAAAAVGGGTSSVPVPASKGGDANGFDDDFFNESGNVDEDVWDADEARTFVVDAGTEEGGSKSKKKDNKKLNKKERRALREKEEKERKTSGAELALLVDDEDDEEGGGGKHFDMRSILKSEKEGKKGRKSRSAKKRKEEGSQEVKKDEFEIDLKDDRFASLHDDAEFAIDPSNPKFQKTRNMSALLAEGRKRRSKQRDTPRAPVGAAGSAKASASSAKNEEARLNALVEAVKRKAGAGDEARGKRARLD